MNIFPVDKDVIISVIPALLVEKPYSVVQLVQYDTDVVTGRAQNEVLRSSVTTDGRMTAERKDLLCWKKILQIDFTCLLAVHFVFVYGWGQVTCYRQFLNINVFIWVITCVHVFWFRRISEVKYRLDSQSLTFRQLAQKSTVLGNKETLLAIYCQVLTMYAQTFRLIYVIWECKHVPLSVFDDDIVLLLRPRDPPDTGLYTVVLDYRKLNHGQTFVTFKLVNKNSGVVWLCIDLKRYIYQWSKNQSAQINTSICHR